MKKLILAVLMFTTVIAVSGQTRYCTKNGKIFFSASSPMEKIEATNEKATSVVDVSNGAIEFAVLMKAFSFDKALMQEHFNENYVESDKFPKAVFKGSVTNIKSVDMTKNGVYPVKVKGTLTLHGETKDVLADGSLTVKDGNITTGKSHFKILLEDFKIEIPSLVKDKISKEVQIDVDLNYEPYKTS
jgi:polyisoprenoid-binding protein YceI